MALEALRDDDQGLPDLARSALGGLADQLEQLGAEIGRLERQILEWHRQDETSRRLATIPGIGPITASALAASAPDPKLFRSGRQFAAWLGLTPRANSSGGKERQGGISKMGDGYLRRLLVVGATAVLRMARQRGREGWVGNLLERKKPKVAAVALANKTARIAWTLMARQEDSRENSREPICAPETESRDVGVFCWGRPSPDPHVDPALRPLRRSPADFLVRGSLEWWWRLGDSNT